MPIGLRVLLVVQLSLQYINTEVILKLLLLCLHCCATLTLHTLVVTVNVTQMTHFKPYKIHCRKLLRPPIEIF